MLACMSMHRRSLLHWLAACPALLAPRLAPAAVASSLSRAALRFPVDFGSHPEARTEWWYVTGSLQAGPKLWGFQVTFFRSSTGVTSAQSSASSPASSASKFDPAQLLFAHAAVTDLDARKLRHDQRIARSGFGIAESRLDDTGVTIRDWHMLRTPMPGDAQRSRYTARVASDAAGFAFALTFDTTQPVLLQGDAGVSKKGPAADDISRYYSEPQLAVNGTLTLEGKATQVQGKAWLDHEWSDAFIPPQAIGWDWIGMNLDDGSALTAFRLRRGDGSSVYAGGSYRRVGEAPRSFAPDEVTFVPGRVWESAATRARYPVQWSIVTPVGRFTVNAMLDDQELDSRGSTGSVYWEGISELLDERSSRVGRGYLEMTGYASALRL
jgi:predicted secreted hydrolase